MVLSLCARGEVMDPDDVWEVLDEGDVNDFHE